MKSPAFCALAWLTSCVANLLWQSRDLSLPPPTRSLDAKLLKLGVQMLAMDTEDARGLGFVARSARERTYDQAPLQAGDGLFERQLHQFR
jgi:hypothetical protein